MPGYLKVHMANKKQIPAGTRLTTPGSRETITVSKMPCLGAYAPGGTRTTNPLITSQECEPLHHGTLMHNFVTIINHNYFPFLLLIVMSPWRNSVEGHGHTTHRNPKKKHSIVIVWGQLVGARGLLHNPLPPLHGSTVVFSVYTDCPNKKYNRTVLASIIFKIGNQSK